MMHEERFIETLYGWAAVRDQPTRDGARARANLAILRRGRGKTLDESVELYPIVEQYLPHDAPRWEAERLYLVASLFAAHLTPWRDPPPYTNFGTALRRYVERQVAADNDVRDSVNRRFVALLECDREELPDHLRHMTTLLAEQEIDWHSLLRDLRSWRGNVPHRWAGEFYRPPVVLPAFDDEREPAASVAAAAEPSI